MTHDTTTCTRHIVYTCTCTLISHLKTCIQCTCKYTYSTCIQTLTMSMYGHREMCGQIVYSSVTRNQHDYHCNYCNNMYSTCITSASHSIKERYVYMTHTTASNNSSTHVHVHVLKKEGRKKQAGSNKQQGKATQQTQGSHFS